MTDYDTIVIGAGPAGLSAGLVLGRCMRSVLLVDSGRHRNERSTALHCFMGLDGIPPADLLDRSRHQLLRYENVTRVRTKVSAVRKGELGFIVDSEDGQERHTRTLLVATGVVDELPPIPGIHDFFGSSVHVCPYCDAWEHRNAPVAVFGRGAKGAGLALLLRQWTEDLVLCTHGPDELSRQEAALLEKRGIAVRTTVMTRLEGEGNCLRAIRFEDGKCLTRKALFFTTGQHPRSRLLESLNCDFGEKGVACDEDGLTSVPGVYVAGDASRDVQLVIIASAEGARAALAINKAMLKSDGYL